MARTPSPTQTGSGPGRGTGRNRPEETTGENPRPGGQTVKPEKPPLPVDTSGWGKNLGDGNAPGAGANEGAGQGEYDPNVIADTQRYGQVNLITGYYKNKKGQTQYLDPAELQRIRDKFGFDPGVGAQTIAGGGAGFNIVQTEDQLAALVNGIMSSPFADPDAPNKLLGSHYASLVSAYASVGLPVPEWVAGYFTPDQVAYGQQTLTQGKWGDPNDPDWVMERWADAQIERREGRSQEEPPGDQTPPPGQGHSFIGGFDVEGALGPMGDQELYEVGSALFGMLSTRAAKANAQSAYGDYFEEPGGEF